MNMLKMDKPKTLNCPTQNKRLSRFSGLILVELLVLSLLILAGQTSTTPAQAYAGRTPGAVVAFYYPWYDSRDPGSWWNSNKMGSLPSTQYQSSDMNFVRGQMQQASNAGIDAFAVSWNGPSGDWANRFTQMMSMAANGFTLAVHYETSLLADKSINATVANLTYIRDHYANDPRYFHYEGKPVVFFWQPEQVTPISNWQTIRNQVDPNHTMIWSTDSIDTSVLTVFDSMHLFSAAKWDNNPGAKDQEFRQQVNNFVASHGGERRLWTAGVTPGYDDRKFRSPGEFRDREGGNYYQRSWQAAIGSNPDMITISTWNEWYEGSAIEGGQLWGNQYIDATKQYSRQYKGTNRSLGDSSIMKVWSRTDLQVEAGATARTWMWGPGSFATAREQYNEGPGGSRLVYYFDKSRMEITRPTADPNAQWFVTNGLLVREMMSGKIATGDNSTQNKGSANVPVAGDFSNNPSSPTFASMAGVASLANDKRIGDRTGQTIVDTMANNGQVGQNGNLANYNVKYVHYDSTLGHNIAQPFWNFFQQSGPVWENGTPTTGSVVDWLFAMGYPITDAYWCKVKVGGVEKDVLVQAFERRIMTYTPSNPAGFQVEMGNVGRQYHLWRYGN